MTSETTIPYSALPESLGPEPTLPVFQSRVIEPGCYVLEAYYPDSYQRDRIQRGQERLKALKGVQHIEVTIVTEVPADRVFDPRP